MTWEFDPARYEGHTPGPWHPMKGQTSEDAPFIVIPEQRHEGSVCELYNLNAVKDVYLIADAPALLAECVRLRESWEHRQEANRVLQKEMDTLRAENEALRLLRQELEPLRAVLREAGEALEHYASEKNWHVVRQTSGHGESDTDQVYDPRGKYGGYGHRDGKKVARAALSRIREALGK